MSASSTITPVPDARWDMNRYLAACHRAKQAPGELTDEDIAFVAVYSQAEAQQAVRDRAKAWADDERARLVARAAANVKPETPSQPPDSRFTADDARQVIAGISEAVAEALGERDKRIAELEARAVERIEKLEARPAVKYAGIWRAQDTYTEGALCTRSGGLWLATRDTAATPGTEDSGWTLVVKSGSYARD